MCARYMPNCKTPALVYLFDYSFVVFENVQCRAHAEQSGIWRFMVNECLHVVPHVSGFEFDEQAWSRLFGFFCFSRIQDAGDLVFSASASCGLKKTDAHR